MKSNYAAGGVLVVFILILVLWATKAPATPEVPKAIDTAAVSADQRPVEAAATAPDAQVAKPQGATVDVAITSKNFSFDRTEIRVKKGDTVRVTLKNEGGLHDWVVDQFNAATSKVGAGETTSVEFVANKAGTFEYYCSIGEHRQMGMKGNLIVE
jgi:plastocyanin